jgi:hypothetical protein
MCLEYFGLIVVVVVVGGGGGLLIAVRNHPFKNK